MIKKILSRALIVLASLTLLECAPGGGTISTNTNGVISAIHNAGATLNITGNEINVMPVTVGCGYINEPCVDVIICVPGTSTCQTIHNLLLDTGSYGLRIFSSAVSLSLPQQTASGGGNYAECVTYADLSHQWGPVKTADIKLGGLTASGVPIQIVDASYPTTGAIPNNCNSNIDTASAGYNGILGVGMNIADCGTNCTVATQHYFSCTSTTCTQAGIPIAQQVTNPIAMLPTNYNNGVALQLPDVQDNGSVSASGYVAFGIGTVADNTPTSVAVFNADANLEFRTSYKGNTLVDSYIDSGSNALYFHDSSIYTGCSSDGWMCPTSTLSLTGTAIGVSSSAQEFIDFNIADAANLLSNSNTSMVFNNLGNDPGAGSTTFDWGLPFFLGRTIYVGISTRTSSLGTGPYWAF